MPIHLPNARYVLSFEQKQRIEHAASALAVEQRPLFRQRVQQIVRTPMGRGIVTNAMVGVAISAATRELTEKAAR
jgi:hypothetical protein